MGISNAFQCFHYYYWKCFIRYSSGIKITEKKDFNNLKIFEAEPRIGGRIHSVKFGNAFVDVGAAFCHGEKDNIVYSLVKDINVLRHSQFQISVYKSNGEFLDDAEHEKIEEFSNSISNSNNPSDECATATSVEECLGIKTNNLIKTLENDEEKYKIIEMIRVATAKASSYNSALDLHDLALRSLFKLCSGDFYMNWNGQGYKTILNVLMEKFPNPNQSLPIDDKFNLHKKIKTIKWDNQERPSVITVDGETHEADHIIFTPFLGVLKANHLELFDPDLPEDKVDAINKMGYGAIMKIFLLFPEKWWPNNAFIKTIWKHNDEETLRKKNLEWLISLMGVTTAENNPKVLIAWYLGKYLPIIETFSDEKVLRGQSYVLDKLFSRHFNVSQPHQILRTKWLNNPNFLGTYSYESVVENPNRTIYQEKLERPLTNKNNKPTILFAGEATHPYYFSIVH
ncbi:hypothetical protein ABEB36_007021 [Hypothenemus hampei]|uniref:Amine oxidase domain-containing protein n=1 Tax=Hypothenemus hampei TaxID=57062 RepID=A0ABD1EVK5_HYPHA